jgi:multidrug efflux system membrane fusion protein
VRQEGGSEVVMVVADGTAERRAVRIGAAFGDDVQVIAGLAAGERVVVEGAEGLVDGVRVKEMES